MPNEMCVDFLEVISALTKREPLSLRFTFWCGFIQVEENVISGNFVPLFFDNLNSFKEWLTTYTNQELKRSLCQEELDYPSSKMANVCSSSLIHTRELRSDST